MSFARRRTVEESVCVDLYVLRRAGVLRDGAGRFEYRARTWFATVAWIFDPINEVLHLHVRHPADREATNSTLEIVRVAQPFGGERWFFRCPELGIVVPCAYLPPSTYRFASREAHGLVYDSQRRSWRWRALERRAKLAYKLRAQRFGAPGHVPARPLGMWRRTYRRLAEEWREVSRRLHRFQGHEV